MTSDLDRWLEQATRRLSKDSAVQVRTEIQEHYQSAREAAISGGASQDEANRMALIALGDAKTADKQYLRVLLTASESGTLSKTWWLLALCGIFDAMYATLYLLLMNPLLISRTIGSTSDAGWDLGLFALLAGACVIAAGFGQSERIIPGFCRFMASRLAPSESSSFPWAEAHVRWAFVRCPCCLR